MPDERRINMWQYRHTVLLLHFLVWGFIAMDRMLVVFVSPQMVPALPGDIRPLRLPGW
jgi:hypothetical protein